MMKIYNARLLHGDALNINESYQATMEILNTATEVEIAAFLSLMAKKGVTSAELLGVIRCLKEMMQSLTFPFPVLDIVGTGGDNAGTINISTTAALLTAACGIPVIKHGNRAASSNCGSADVLEVLGYHIKQSQEELFTQLHMTNFAFCFAPMYHPVLAKVRKIRRELGFPTLFNLAAPFLNPANAEHLMLGVYDQALVPLLAETLASLGTNKSLVFNAHGLDELSTLGGSKPNAQVIEALLVTKNKIEPLVIDTKELGFRPAPLSDLAGADAWYNAEIIRQTLSGVRTGLTDTTVLNAAVALFLYGRVKSIAEGVKIAQERLKQGKILAENRLYEIALAKRQELNLHASISVNTNADAYVEQQQYLCKSLKAAILSKPGAAIIGEIKRASPSSGKLADIVDPVAKAKQYVACGVIGLSVLTDKHFLGSLDDLSKVAASLCSSPIPILCKDFIFTPEQIALAKQSGANAILLIVALLHDRIPELVAIAHAFGLETIVEVHHESELAIALDSGSDIIGINQRDLRDFSMQPELFARLISKIPKQMVKIAESGINNLDEAQAVYQLGYDGILVGSALSRDEFFAA